MERFWRKNIRRTLGLIICAALIISVIFQNDALASAEADGAGEDTQGNRFYLNGIMVTADHDPELLTGQALSDGEHKYVIDSEGKLQFDESFMTVSGGDAGSASGGDAGNLYFYVMSDMQQLELTYVDTEAFFGMDAPIIIQPGDPDKTYTIELNRKFSLAEPVVKLRGEGGELTELTSGSYSYSYTDSNGTPVQAPIRSGEYQATVTWVGITSQSVSYDTIKTDIPSVEYRDYIIYGEYNDFYVTATENGQEKIVEALTEGKSYAIQSIVIKGREYFDNENPFNFYRIADEQGIVLEEGYVTSQDTIVNNIKKSGILTVTMYLKDGDEEHRASNEVSFIADNAAPELISLTYQTSAAENRGEEPKRVEIAPDGSLQFTDADTITDRDKIVLKLTVSEASGIGNAEISYIMDEAAEVTTESFAMEESDEGIGVYSGSYTITGNVNLTQIQFTVTDILGHGNQWGTLSAIVDNIVPQIEENEIRLTNENGSTAIENNRIIKQEAVTIEIPVFENNDLSKKDILLSYLTDGHKAEEINYNLYRRSGNNNDGWYILSIPLEINRTYTDFEITITDRAGNYVDYAPGWEFILDAAAPDLEKVEWTADDKKDKRYVLAENSREEVTAKQELQLLFTVSERNDITDAVLYYEKDGVQEETPVTITEDSGASAYDERKIIFEVTFSEEANYQNFRLTLKDIAGNETEQEFLWKVFVDDTLPAIDTVTWTSGESSEPEDVSKPILLVDKEQVTLTIDVKEKNIAEVELCRLNDMGQATAVETIKQGSDTPQESFTCVINKTDYNYQNLVIRVTDKSGNETIYSDKDGNPVTIQIIIDRQAPVLEKLQQLQPEKGAWYHGPDSAVQYSFDLKDYSEIKSIQMVAEPETGEQIVWDLTDDYKKEKVTERDSEGYFIYHIVTDASRFLTAADQDTKYYFKIADEWDNEMSTTGEPQKTVEMRVDNTPPSSAAYVKFQGGQDKFYNTLDELVVMEDKQYQYGSQSGMLFNNDRVELTIYVADQAADQAVNQAASGIRQVKVTYCYTDTSVTGTKDQSRVLTYEEGSENQSIIRQAASISTAGKTMLMDAISFELKVTGSQQITAIDSIEITDYAGNVTVIREYIGTGGLTVDYVLDNKAPELSHVIPAGSSGYSEDSNTYYYNSNAVDLFVTIAENNFYPAEVLSNLQAGEANKAISMEAFQNIGNYQYRSRFSMNEGDGRYRFSLSYTDRSGNAMIFQGGGGEAYVADGVYTSPTLVLDTVAPNISIRYYKDGNDITDSVTGGKCVNGEVSAVISITETNFDPRLVQIAFRATDASDNHAFSINYNPEGWSQSGNTYSYTIPCTIEGRYSLTASCVDKAGNGSNNIPASDFIVDKTAPAVTISYDTTVESGYYNTDRVATVTVTEQNFSEETADYAITSTGALPGTANWSHTAGSGCSELQHVKSCRWSGRVVFHEDADYTFTFGCADMAGNTSSPIEEQAFTIDQTLPVIEVGYDNNDSLNGNFFREGRTASVTITEHNFVSSEVNLAVISPDGEIHTPSVWRDAGADTYICQIAYDTDGDYTFDISYVDPAGNEAQAYAGDRFVIDLTAPELEISGVTDRSANNGVVAPVVTYSDKNYDAEEVSIRIAGVNHGQISPEHTVTTNEDGQTIAFMDFSHVQELDDLYTLEAVITDKAGNSTTDSILFSVNRFGSTYLFSRGTQEVLDRCYTNQGPDLDITEINVDTLEHREISYSCDGNTVVLEQGDDYTVQESGGEYEWKQYTYKIPGSNFDTEGVYVVTLQSVDRASNDVTNRIKEKNIEFTVDKTAPSVVLGGIENGGSYAETSRSLTIDAVDNIYLKSVDIYLNSQLAASFDEDTLAEYHGVVSYEIRETGSAQTVYVVARDAAGNEAQTDAISFLISSNAFIRWFYNKPLFFGSIAAVAALAGGVILISFGKRRKKDERKVSA
ncbi:MAG: Ig-like domain repeat protein [Acetatifactor sp.]|nr:Ig-like domain repeat protein [Acetatifactor sp.]